MPIDWEKLQTFLNNVSKPGRYVGEEFNIQKKEWHPSDLKVLLAFPDIYEIGLSHLGLRILYELINAQPRMLAERAYAPWSDFQKLLRELNIPLYGLESKHGMLEYDVVGFSMQYELSYTNVLTMLDLGGVPLIAKERTAEHPLVIGGGPCAFNPEPVAAVFDFFVLGEVEEVLVEILETVRAGKQSGKSRPDLLGEVAKHPGVYVPSLFEVSYHSDGTIQAINSQNGLYPSRVVVHDFEKVAAPQQWLVPYMGIVHDRVVYEIQRGCSRGCRFCQAGMIYRPVRERAAHDIITDLKKLIANTGYEELSLTSLSSADYSQIGSLITEACGCFTPLRVNVSLPSLRVDSFSVDLAAKFQSNRKGSLTFAPEAGSERLRRVINKGVTREDLLTAAEAAFKAGWQKLKLYFMIGLPTETEEDIAGIVDLANEVVRIGKQVHPRCNSLRVTVSVSTFVPKAHTPFQWRRQDSITETQVKQRFLKERVRGRYLEFNWNDPQMSRLEGVMARGDRRVNQAIIKAWEKGAQFDGWSDQFQARLWDEAFAECGLEPEFYTREHSYEEIIPWSHLNSGVTTEFLKQEDQKADLGVKTPDCRENDCSNCGICSGLKVTKQIAGGVNG